jgi:hypothetical protein
MYWVQAGNCNHKPASLESTGDFVADERLLEDPENLTDKPTAPIGSYAHRCQDKSKAC